MLGSVLCLTLANAQQRLATPCEVNESSLDTLSAAIASRSGMRSCMRAHAHATFDNPCSHARVPVR